MPIYEYQCQKCGKVFDYIQKFSDSPKTKCEECKGKLKKLISETAFQLKGTGWYVTDFKDKKKNQKAGNSSQESGDSRQKSGDGSQETEVKTKTETKAESKTEKKVETSKDNS